jgi:hypothetical protein
VGETEKKPRITQRIQSSIAGRNILIVDDVADTGESLVVIKKYLKSKKPRTMNVATMYIKPWSKVLPDYYTSKTSAWIIFPWELYETIKLLSARNVIADLSKTHIPARYAKMLYEMDDKLRRI